jgi:predicted TIM-barrel enzyme
MNFKDVFPREKPILAMLHLKGESHEEILKRAQKEADLLISCGVDGVIVEDYFGDEEDVVAVLKWLKEERPHYCYGVNVLDQFSKSYLLAEEYGAKFMQVDSICGHLTPEEDAAYEQECKRYYSRNTVLIMGGVRFKYKEVLSGRSLKEDLKLGMERCDVIVVTGEGTGMNTDIEKIREFRSIIGDFPLIVGAGLTAHTVAEQLSVADGGIVGSCLKDTRKADGDVSQAHTLEFMREVRNLRKE